uniref:Uncharacterized protein n=1 Tax=Coturnix japonica TaxID=93934 RepID=A0A8C2T326_COTJA
MALLLCPSRLITQALLFLIQAPCPAASFTVPALPKHRGGHTAHGNLHFIVSSTQSYSNTVQEGDKKSTNFEVIWRGNSPRLVVKSFTAWEQGTYYCVNFINQELHFSSGQPAFLPAPLPVPSQPGPSPTLPMALLLSQTISSHSNENTPRFCHDTFIWVNLAGTCLLLLLTAITINITHCQSKSHPDTLQSLMEPHTTEPSRAAGAAWGRSRPFP